MGLSDIESFYETAAALGSPQPAASYSQIIIASVDAINYVGEPIFTGIFVSREEAFRALARWCLRQIVIHNLFPFTYKGTDTVDEEGLRRWLLTASPEQVVEMYFDNFFDHEYVLHYQVLEPTPAWGNENELDTIFVSRKE